MPAIRVVDLDELFVPDVAVVIGGERYIVPGSPPMDYFLWMNDFIERTGGENAVTMDDVKALYEHTLALLRIHQPDLDRVPIGSAACFAFFNRVYMAGNTDGEDAEARPTRATRGATKSRPARSRSRS
jgi:hypothetical protein